MYFNLIHLVCFITGTLYIMYTCLQVQYNRNGGRCGVCGDPFHGPIQNQPGPDNVYAQGVITATYTEADEFTAKVQV